VRVVKSTIKIMRA